MTASINDEATGKIRNLIRQRTSLKGKITISLGKLTDDDSPAVIVACQEFVAANLDKISKCDEEINAIYEKDSSDPEVIKDDHMKKLESQTNYSLKITTRLKELNMPDHKTISACKMDVKLPNLQCAFFSGEAHTATEYSAFIVQFNNVVGLRANLSESVKLTYLRSYLRGYAFKVISHLTISEENYPVVLALLEREFLNKDLIIEELFNKLTNLKPKSETYVDLKVYVSEIRCVLSDLKLHAIDLLKDFSPAKFISHIIFNILPLDFKQELVRKLDNGYPSFAQIEDNYMEVIRTLELKNKPKFKDVHFAKTEVRAKDNFSTFNINAVKSSATSDAFEKACKFCNVKGHSMYKCKKFCTYNIRVSRCKELNLCSSCSSSRHLAEACPGKLKFECNNCKSNSHIAALCNKTTSNVNICLNSYAGSNDYLFPTLTITIYYGLKRTKVRSLLDTGSQRSYVSSRALDRINYPACQDSQEFVISTFLEKRSRKFAEVSLAVNSGDSSRTCQLSFLLDDNLQLSLSVASLPDAITNIRSKHSLADCSFTNCSSEEIVLEGLLGIDALQTFNFQSTKVLNGSAWQVANAVVPYGAIDSFLTNEQLTRKYEPSNLSSSDSSVLQSVVSCALQPKGSHFDPVAALYPESQIENHLNNFFSMESIGIPANERSDDEQMKSFEKSISFENGKYHVGLPWIQDKINKVPSNFLYAKAILAKVVENLTNRSLLSDYRAIFEEQLAEGIIEEMDLNQMDTSKNQWLPNRPVIKQSPEVTTKIRPVLNSSFKVKDSVSLNDAAYKGVNLINNLLDLLVKIRANKYLVVSDIRKAFLQIKLSSTVDRNKFSILWIHPDGSLRAFRYCTIVFGYVASPFILQCVMRYHLQKLPPSGCRNMLLNNFYVDNLFYSGDNIEILDKFYRESCELMESGGFTLRSWFQTV